MQDLSRFKLQKNFRGRSALAVQIWWVVQATLFRASPQIAYGYRRWLLRCFGAKVGERAIIRASVKITYPWKVIVGENAWIGDDVVLYSLANIEIGRNAVVSQRSYLCTGSHDYTKIDFPLHAFKITVMDEAWVAADVFIAPGVIIGQGAVIGARSSVFANMPEGMVCFGYPCKPVRIRLNESDHGTNSVVS